MSPNMQDRDKAGERTISEFIAMTWRAIPSIQAYWPEMPGRVTSIIVTDGKWGSENTPVLLANNLEPEIAEHICRAHNAYISPPKASLPTSETER